MIKVHWKVQLYAGGRIWDGVREFSDKNATASAATLRSLTVMKVARDMGFDRRDVQITKIER